MVISGPKPTQLLEHYLDNNRASSLESEAELTQLSQDRALELFRQAATKVPAYKDFLRLNKVNPSDIRTIADFHALPATTKDNYIKVYPLHQRCWDGKLPGNHMISTSSGTNGEPQYWPRSLTHELDGALAHELIFDAVLNLKRKNTLFINGFAMGNWIAGTFTSASTNLLSWKGFPLTNMTPGYSLEAIIQTLKDMAPYFEHLVIAGHSPFLKEVVEEAPLQGIEWDKLSGTLLGTGQAVTENWRDYIISVLKPQDPYRAFINLYGSADAALMGFETPLTIKLRQHLVTDPALTDDLFNDSRVPALFQYDPILTYFDAIGGELHLTKDYGIPLIHYNIEDHGGTFSYSDLKSQFRALKLNQELERQLHYRFQPLPFVYLFGRDKFMVKLYGANLYTEHVQHALNHAELQPFLTGRFVMKLTEDQAHNPRLLCQLELKNNVGDIVNLSDKTTEIFMMEVAKLNKEYQFLVHQLGDKVKPQIELVEYGRSDLFPKDKVKKTA